jgi:uncharacterized protein YecE (DUF72 family)
VTDQAGSDGRTGVSRTPSRSVPHVGTSGWSYASWKPGFYPADAQPEDFLAYYAQHFDTVELNTTGYRLPAEQQFDRWAEQTPPGFTFAVKMPARGFRDLTTFEERAGRLGDRLGPVRVVVERPRDDGLLPYFLGSTAGGIRYAFDFRDESWDDPSVDDRLAEAGAVRVNARQAETPFRYLRFRDPPYGDADIARIAAEIRPLDAEVFAYFRHEDQPTAPAYAQKLLSSLG